jgi:hypothetical protein
MYGKVFEQLYTSTLATKGPWQAMALWPHLIAMADQHGEVDMPLEIIARKTTLPEDLVRTAINALSEPDPMSRSQECEGRRIVLIDPRRPWGWRLVNYEHYASIRNEEERRAYQAKWKREKNQRVKDGVDTGRQQSTKSTHTYTDSDTKKTIVRSAHEGTFETFWSIWPRSQRKVGKAACLKKWLALKPDRDTEFVIFAHVRAMATTKQWKD